MKAEKLSPYTDYFSKLVFFGFLLLTVLMVKRVNHLFILISAYSMLICYAILLPILIVCGQIEIIIPYSDYSSKLIFFACLLLTVLW